MNHSFDVEIAVKYGVNAAILLNNLFFWVQKNKANNRNFHDGTYWTYNSRSAFTEIFPYMSEHQIKIALGKLIDDGIIITGNYNKDARDRSLWYALTEKGFCIVQKCQMQTEKMSNASDKNGQPLPDINPDRKPDNKPYIPEGFDEFWSVYPRKIAKSTAFKSWKSLNPDYDLRDRIISNVKARLNGEWKGKDMTYIPHPTTYLNQRRWEDETETPRRIEGDHLPFTQPPSVSPDERKAMHEALRNGTFFQKYKDG